MTPSRGLIIETDIGDDPDDYLMLLYLLMHEVPVRAILVSPGHPSQVAFCRQLFRETGAAMPLIGVAGRAHWQRPVNRLHQGFMTRAHGWLDFQHDGPGHEIARAVLAADPMTDLFVCGPPLNTAQLFSRDPAQTVGRMTIQGGFVGPRAHGLPCIRLPESEHASSLPSYNLNADPAGAQVLLHAPAGERRLIGRNVCHAVRYTMARHQARPPWPKDHPAVRLFEAHAPRILLRRPEKKIHDVVAMLAHLRPELFTWVRGRAFTRITWDGRRLWGTTLREDGDLVAIDIDLPRFWEAYLAPPGKLTATEMRGQAGGDHRRR